MRFSGRDRQAGFALVESVVVLALSGLVLLTLVIATDLVSRNSAAAAQGANTIETLATGFSAIRRDLEGARFIRVGTAPEDAVLFSGTGQAVAFAVSDDGAGTGQGESLILIEARYEQGRGVLVRSSAPLPPGTSGFGTAKFANPAVLLSGPWQYRFSYNDPEAEAQTWRGDWPAANHMPSAVRLDVVNDAGAAVVSPLFVRMRIDSGGCAEAAQAECAASVGSHDEDQNQSQKDNAPNNQ